MTLRNLSGSSVCNSEAVEMRFMETFYSGVFLEDVAKCAREAAEKVLVDAKVSVEAKRQPMKCRPHTNRRRNLMSFLIGAALLLLRPLVVLSERLYLTLDRLSLKLQTAEKRFRRRA